MAETKAPKLPTTLWVKQEEEDGGSFFFVGGRTRDNLVETEPTVIAEYQLVNIHTMQLVPQVILVESV